MSQENSNGSNISILQFTVVMSVLCFLGFFTIIYLDSTTIKKCVEERIVTSIDSVQHRTVYFTLDNSIELKVSQPNIKVGGKYCSKYEITKEGFSGTTTTYHEVGKKGL